MAGMGSFAMLPVIYLVRQVDLKDADNLFYAKSAYVSVVAILLGLYAYIYTVVQNKKEAALVQVPAPANADGTPGTGTVPIPTWEYDLQELKKAAQQVLMGAAFTALLVLQFNVYQVLLIQPLMLLRGAFTSPIVRIHVLGYAATDANKRPFVVSNPLADMMKKFTEGSGQPAADAAAAPAIEGAATTTSSKAGSKSGKATKRH